MQLNNCLKLSFATFLVTASSPIFAQQRPNILIIMTDQLSAESMSCRLGNQFLATPNLDDLVRHGVSFVNAYCANPLCVPSRSSLFTGRYPHELGIQTNEEKKIDPSEFPTLGTIFNHSGYETGYIGKWHLPYDRNLPETHGFSFLPNKKGNGSDSLSPGQAARFFGMNRQKPFLLVVSFMNPHNICQWPRGEKLPDGEIGDPPPPSACPPLRNNAKPSVHETDIMQLMRSSMQASDLFPVANFTDDKWRQYLWAYYRMIEKVDGEIGKVLRSLREAGLEKNTLIVFMSDHGDCQGAHRWNQKTVFFEEATKVPFVFNYPGIQPFQSDFLVQTGIDLLPTLCDFAGIAMPSHIRGNSLRSLILKEKTKADRTYIVVSDHLIQGAAIDGKKPEPEGRMLRNQRFKYWIYNEGSRRETLYNLTDDPGEMVNLADNPAYAAALKQCRKELWDWSIINKDPYQLFLIQP